MRDAELTPNQKFQNHLQNHLQNFGDFCRETHPSTVVATIGAIASFYLLPHLAPTLLGIAISTLASRLITKIILNLTSSYTLESLKELENKIWTFDKNYWMIYYIALAIAIAITPFFPIIGLILAILAGTYHGLIVEIAHKKNIQSIDETQIPNTSKFTTQSPPSH